MTTRTSSATTNAASRPRQKLTIVCENYWPEVASTAQLICELAEGLADGFEVEVLTARPKYNSVEHRPDAEERNGVSIRRLRSTSFARASKAGRLTNWLSFLVSLSGAIMHRWHGDRTYIFVTNPPTAPWAALLTRLQRKSSYILVYDLYPDLAEAIGAVRTGGLAARAFDRVNRAAFRATNGLIALGEDMRRRLIEKLGDTVPITVIANWADGERIRPLAKNGSDFARAHGLDGRFVFLYAGNLGLFQDLETLGEAVMQLPEGSSAPVLVFVGQGGKRGAVEAMAQRSERIKVFDYVPYEAIGDMYAAADVGLIALEPGVEMTNVPSKTYSILAAGKPFLAVCAGSTDLGLLAEQGCGVRVPNDATRVSQAMLGLIESPDRTEAMGRRARQVFEQRFSRVSAIESYKSLISNLEEKAA